MALDGVSGGSGVGGNEGGEMIGEDVKGVAEEVVEFKKVRV